MASKNNERVIEEGVIIVLGEQNEPVALVRKSFENGGKIEMYNLELMGFSDIKPFLSVLAQQPLVITSKDKDQINITMGPGGGGGNIGNVGGGVAPSGGGLAGRTDMNGAH